VNLSFGGSLGGSVTGCASLLPREDLVGASRVGDTITDRACEEGVVGGAGLGIDGGGSDGHDSERLEEHYVRYVVG